MDDISNAEYVEVTVDSAGKLCVKVEDKCVLQISHCKLIMMDDPLRGFDIVYGEAQD